ncbi:MAG: hypothetical protein FJ194_05970 [Gammaproteobacteria bacterium]|nr:hypothetical protein [Gammaproteobacteria bacterium]
MSHPDELQEVLFFLADDLAIESVMPWSEFEAVQMGAASLPAFAGRTLKAVFAGVDDELVIRGLVLFQLTMNDDGKPAPMNLPLGHLMMSGGTGPDLGHGATRLASRAQCPVPWHQRHMWHSDDVEGLRQLQQAVFHNPAGLIQRRQQLLAVEAAASPAKDPGFDRGFTPSTDALRVELQSLRDKLRHANGEVDRLKAALAHEQDRNRRLQDRLLGR